LGGHKDLSELARRTAIVTDKAPEDGLYDVTATFDEAGTYILWGRADDGGLYHGDYITVHVTK